MRRPGYREAVEYVALNDDSANMCGDSTDPDWIGNQVTVCMVADLWEVERERVAADVLKVREREFGD